MTSYTVFDANDSSRIYGAGLTAEEAMSEILTYDGYRYEIRQSKFVNGRPCWDLWHSDGSENSPRGARHLVKTLAFSLESDEAVAAREIAEQVIYAGWPGMPECMTDEAFAAMVAQAASDNDDE